MSGSTPGQVRHEGAWPDWYDGKHLNEVLFCQSFLRDHPIKSVNGTFFTVEGRMTDENGLKKEIYDLIKPFFVTGLSKRITNLLDTMRMECYRLLQKSIRSDTNSKLKRDNLYFPQLWDNKR